MTRGQTGGQEVRDGRTATAAARVLRRSAAIIGLFIVVLLVAWVWLAAGSPEPRARTYSPAEQAQLDAEERYRALAADARSAAALDPALAGRLSAIATDLEAQADAVSLLRTPGPAATDTGGPASATLRPTVRPTAGTSAGATVTEVDGTRVLSMLRDSALRSLHDAVGAEPGPARVLASAGSNQWRQAVLLGQALGADPGLPPADSLSDPLSAVGLAADATASEPPTDPVPQDRGTPATEPSAAPGPSRGGATASGGGAPEECAPLGPDADRRALLDAREAEDRARYGYEVAAALLPDPAGALERAAVHRAAADAAAARLAELCAPAAAPPAGFALRPAFRTDPAAALRELEQDHAELYAGLVSAVGPNLRAWAVASCNAAVQRSLDAGTPLTPFPGLAPDAAGSPGGASDPTPAPAPPAGQSGG